MGGKGDGWRMPDESWLEMEAAKDRETFFINVVPEDMELLRWRAKGN